VLISTPLDIKDQVLHLLASSRTRREVFLGFIWKGTVSLYTLFRYIL